MKHVNDYFSRILVINLYDNNHRWKTMKRHLKYRGIEAQRFAAIDGRCKNEQESIEKLKSLELTHNISIHCKYNVSTRSFLPAASLSIGTITILRAIVRNKWKHTLVLEDDVYFVRGFAKKFDTLTAELKGVSWDLLYLGHGGSGYNGIRIGKDRKHKHSSLWETNVHVENKDDLRTYCQDGGVSKVTPHISRIYDPYGTWGYAYSLDGAKKLLTLLSDTIDDHIDQAIITFVERGKLVALAADPPLVMHQDLREGRTSDIPWYDEPT
jgi:GR25 family glycosyltransferase involved in LPS biosynthesis